jgi:sulfite exporter TauE/SafE
MNMELGLLVLTAVSIGFVHTLLGPDHYLPFVAMSAARNWTRRKTMLVTAFCGVGHVLGSILIGLIGIAIGASLHRLQWLEGVRGDLAAWALIAFGLVYMAWGLKQAWPMSTSTRTVPVTGTRTVITRRTSTCTSTSRSTPTTSAASRRGRCS